MNTKLALATLALSFLLLSGCSSTHYYIHGRGQFVISSEALPTPPPLQPLEHPNATPLRR